VTPLRAVRDDYSAPPRVRSRDSRSTKREARGLSAPPSDRFFPRAGRLRRRGKRTPKIRSRVWPRRTSGRSSANIRPPCVSALPRSREGTRLSVLLGANPGTVEQRHAICSHQATPVHRRALARVTPPSSSGRTTDLSARAEQKHDQLPTPRSGVGGRGNYCPPSGSPHVRASVSKDRQPSEERRECLEKN